MPEMLEERRQDINIMKEFITEYQVYFLSLSWAMMFGGVYLIYKGVKQLREERKGGN